LLYKLAKGEIYEEEAGIKELKKNVLQHG